MTRTTAFPHPISYRKAGATREWIRITRSLYVNEAHNILKTRPGRPGAPFSKVPETFRARKAVAKSLLLLLQSCFVYVFLIWTEVPFIQEVSGVYTSPFLDTDELKVALRARKVSGAFEKRAPGWVRKRSFFARDRFSFSKNLHDSRIVVSLCLKSSIVLLFCNKKISDQQWFCTGEYSVVVSLHGLHEFTLRSVKRDGCPLHKQ